MRKVKPDEVEVMDLISDEESCKNKKSEKEKNVHDTKEEEKRK